MKNKIIFVIVSSLVLISCGEKRENTSPKNKDEKPAVESKPKNAEAAKPAEPKAEKPCIPCRAGKIKWTQISNVPADLLEKITNAGGQTNAIFKGQQARISVHCEKNKEIICSVKTGKLEKSIQEKLIAVLTEKIFEQTADGIIDLLCEKANDQWSCRYSMVPENRK